MIAISTKTANADGYVVINEKKTSRLEDVPARVSRVKLLNGGVHINHSGVSHGDRTLNVVASMTTCDRNKLISIYQIETIIHVATADGFFFFLISNVRQDNSDTAITILIKNKESE